MKSIVSDRIKSARENLEITMAEASRRLNLSKIGYCRYEYGERTPSAQTLEVIARCFHTSVDYLTGKTDDMSPDCIIISKTDSSALFELVSSIKSSDIQSVERLLAYYKALTQQEERNYK